MMDIVYRPAAETDLERTYQVFLTATNDLLARRNLPLIPDTGQPPPRPLAFRRHALAHDGPRFWVAEDQGVVVGFGVATLREDLWYLAALHVIPGYQGRGIGQRLLQHCLAPDNSPGAQTHIVISDSLNPDSNALYARYGMFQSVPLIALSGIPPASLDPDSTLHTEQLLPGDARLSEVDRLDRHVLGVTRRIDHELWLAQPDLTAYLVSRADHSLGYVYVSRLGSIGPAAVWDTTAMPTLLAVALRVLRQQGVSEVSVKTPGLCTTGLDALLRWGFRYGGLLLIDASQPFGRLGQYLISGGDALF